MTCEIEACEVKQNPFAWGSSKSKRKKNFGENYILEDRVDLVAELFSARNLS
jgi:hypothetical protein